MCLYDLRCLIRLFTASLKFTLWERGQSKGGQELSDRVEMSELLLDAYQPRSLSLSASPNLKRGNATR